MITVYNVELNDHYYDEKNDRYIVPLWHGADPNLYDCKALCTDDDGDLVEYDRIYLTGREISKMKHIG